jgi:hypothetical protein
MVSERLGLIALGREFPQFLQRSIGPTVLFAAPHRGARYPVQGFTLSESIA